MARESISKDRRSATRRSGRRRTQQERRQETQRRVLDATVECLAQRGYARTTTTRIAHMAGVSRGAVLHYYASKEELLTSALDHVFRRRREEFRTAFATLPRGADRVAAAIDILWEMFSGSIFHAWLELVVAARGDRTLHGHVQRVTAGFAAEVQRTFTELFGTAEPSNALFAAAPHFAFALLQGLALERGITGHDDGALRSTLDALKTLGGIVLGTPSIEEGDPHADAYRHDH